MVLLFNLQTVQFSLETGPNPGWEGDDLCLMSNDIPRSFSPQVQEDSDSEEVVGKDKFVVLGI